jgi:hypothetical protein
VIAMSRLVTAEPAPGAQAGDVAVGARRRTGRAEQEVVRMQRP